MAKNFFGCPMVGVSHYTHKLGVSLYTHKMPARNGQDSAQVHALTFLMRLSVAETFDYSVGEGGSVWALGKRTASMGLGS
jgi:hypothetical protein